MIFKQANFPAIKGAHAHFSSEVDANLAPINFFQGAQAAQLEKMALKMSAYELDRLERIKENQKMLEELFPEGTPDVVKSVPRTRKRRALQGDSLGGTGSGSEASYNSDEEDSKPKRVYQQRFVQCPCQS